MNHPVPRRLLSPLVLFQALPPFKLRDLGDKEKVDEWLVCRSAMIAKSI
jgi:hypothetical protein